MPMNGLDDARQVAEIIRARMKHDVIGRDEVIELVLIAMFGDGHVLLEDYPGSGKTTLAKALGGSIIDDIHDDDIPGFRRVQFTPDLLPSDVTGVMVFDTETNSFHFRRGPLFAYIVLVDEINRTSPKVQSALLEAMAEKQVTVDNVSHPLDELFFVIATQNPLDAVGTYPLPLAQLDRFLFKLRMDHIARDAELAVLATWGQPRQQMDLPRVLRGDVTRARDVVRRTVAVGPHIHEALVDIAQRLRDDERCTQGVSTRSLVNAIAALQTRAMLHGRDFISTDDIERLATPLFQHRIGVLPGTDDPARVVRDALAAPLERVTRKAL